MRTHKNYYGEMNRVRRSIGLLKSAAHLLRRTGEFFEFSRARLLTAMWIVVIFCVPVYVTMWVFDPTGYLRVQILLTVLVTIMPLVPLLRETNISPQMSRMERRRLSGRTVLFGMFLWAACGLAASERFDWHVAGLQFVVFFMLPLILLPIWDRCHKESLVLAAFALATALMMAYLALAIYQEGDGWELVLLPLLFATMGAFVWAPTTAWLLGLARRRKNHKLSGPGLQALAMVLLFMPTVFAATTFPLALRLGQVWVAVSLLLAGVLVSAVVGDPLRRFLVEWARLKPFVE